MIKYVLPVYSGALAAPTNVTISPRTCTSVIVSWNGVNGTTAYSVEVTSIQNGVTGGSTLVTFVTGHEKTGLMCTKTKISFFALNSSAYKVTYLEKVSEESAAF